MNVDPRWDTGGWGHRVKTHDELMRAVSRIGMFRERRYAWRGVVSRTFRVNSSLVRSLTSGGGRRALTIPREHEVRAREEFILQEARKWGIGLDVSRPTDFHLLAILQHYGVPTRLLDVTSNPLTALWFACQPASNPDVDGALFAFDITDFPQYNTFTYSEEAYPDGRPLTLASALRISTEEQLPFILRPIFKDARMQAQEGFFVSGAVPVEVDIGGVDGMPIPGVVSPPGAEAFRCLLDPSCATARGRPNRLPFVVLIIPPRVKRSMVTYLEGTFNRSMRTLFPDVQGFRDAVRAGLVDSERRRQPRPVLRPGHK
ncbi:FRG domain-containing protein [Streptomyces sp. NBC_00124]|uniref:FRG domain-containing protein n=1 Tax=Streptomyces sp. NBC_00124 TaxID=2975662 RepID=UPI00338EF0BC